MSKIQKVNYDIHLHYKVVSFIVGTFFIYEIKKELFSLSWNNINIEEKKGAQGENV